MSKKERPILMSAPNVRPTMDGSKTQTRRVFKAKNGSLWPNPNDLPGMRQILRNCPYGQPGDRLWVREAWSTHACFDHLPPSKCPKSIHYWADGEIQTGKARPSIHMPRWASRITLEITGVRVERLQDISEADAIAEGIDPKQANKTLLSIGAKTISGPVAEYSALWESINGADSWNANPWVWVIEFRRVVAA